MLFEWCQLPDFESSSFVFDGFCTCDDDMMEFADADTTLLSFDELLDPSCLWIIVDTGDVGVALDVVIRIVVVDEDENCDEPFELWPESREEIKLCNHLKWIDSLTIAGHTIILIAYVLTTFGWWWRWWFVLVAGRWARWVRWVWRWILIMLIICTRWDFIYTLAATAARTVFSLLILLFFLVFILRGRRTSRCTTSARRDDVCRCARAARVRNLRVGARRAALRRAAAARLFLLAAGRWRRGRERSGGERIHRTIWWARRLMRSVCVFLRRRWWIWGVGFVGDGLVRRNRLHIAAFLLKCKQFA